MFASTKAFSGFAVDDLPKAKEFYESTLGLSVSGGDGLLTLHLAGGRDTLVYPKPDFTPATYTILNFPVDDIDEAVDELAALALRGGQGRRPKHSNAVSKMRLVNAVCRFVELAQR